MMDSFIYNTRISIDAAAGGALMNRSVDEAYDLIDSMALNQNHWSSERQTLKSTPGRHEVDQITLIHAKLDTLTRNLGRTNVSAVGNALPCEICGGDHHTGIECG
jgi:hypothetical protein